MNGSLLRHFRLFKNFFIFLIGFHGNHFDEFVMGSYAVIEQWKGLGCRRGEFGGLKATSLKVSETSSLLVTISVDFANGSPIAARQGYLPDLGIRQASSR